MMSDANEKNVEDHNFEEVSSVLGRYGLEMNQQTAARRAARLRASRGWRVSASDLEPEEPDQHLRRSRVAHHRARRFARRGKQAPFTAGVHSGW